MNSYIPHNNNNNNNITCDWNDVDSSIIKTDKVSISYNPISRLNFLNSCEILEELGTGNYSRVKKGFRYSCNKIVAIKILNKNSNHAIISNEIKIFSMINNRNNNIIKLFEIINDDRSNKIYLILEYCKLGEIKWHSCNINGVKAQGPSQFTMTRCKEMFTDIVKGLKFLHDLNIIHRDIKPANLLVDRNGTVKLSDFGVSKIISLSTKNYLTFFNKTVGTPAFYSPEICLGNDTWSFFNISKDSDELFLKVGFKSDIWALGITLFCLVFGELPFYSEFDLGLFEMIINDEPSYPTIESIQSIQSDIEKIPNDEEYSAAKSLLLRLLKKNPLERPSIDDLLHDPFVLTERYIYDPVTQESLMNYSNGSSSETFSDNDDDIEGDVEGDAENDAEKENMNVDNEVIDLPLTSSFASLDSYYTESYFMNQPKAQPPKQSDSNAYTLKRPNLRHSLSSNLMMTPLENVDSSSRRSLSSTSSIIHFTSTKSNHPNRYNGVRSRTPENLSRTQSETPSTIDIPQIGSLENKYQDVLPINEQHFMEKSEDSLEQERNIKIGNFFNNHNNNDNNSNNDNTKSSNNNLISSSVSSFSSFSSCLSQDNYHMAIPLANASILSMNRLPSLNNSLVLPRNDHILTPEKVDDTNESDSELFFEISPRKARRGRGRTTN